MTDETKCTDEQMDRLVQTFQIAEMEYGEKMDAKGLLFDPALSVEYALGITLNAYAKTLKAKPEWPSDEDVAAACIAHFPEWKRFHQWEREAFRREIRATLQSIRPPAKAEAGVVSDEDDDIHMDVVGRIECDATGELDINWSLEGGIHALEPGAILLCADRYDFIDDTGYAEVYASRHARQVPDEWRLDVAVLLDAVDGLHGHGATDADCKYCDAVNRLSCLFSGSPQPIGSSPPHSCSAESKP